jgi:hypothetical protein
MNYIQPSSELRKKGSGREIFRQPGPAATVAIPALFDQVVLPQFSFPAHRQVADADEPENDASADAILDSPTFTPASLIDFKADGFVRKNRWGVKK